MASKKCFVLYDGCAKGGDTEDAAVLVSALSEGEARHDSKSFKGYDAIWFEYDIVDEELVNETMRADILIPS